MRGLVSVGVLAVTLATARAVHAAGGIVVSVSPVSVAVSQPVEVLVRTFLVVQQSDLSLPFEAPLEPYPVPSGVWSILYSWSDYPFDVVAQHENGTEVSVTLTRDPSDSTLWRGVTSLPQAGTWTIWVRNYPNKGPGSTTAVKVEARPPASSEPTSGSSAPTSGSTAAPDSIDAGAAALVGLLLGLVGLMLGLVGGLAAARHRGRSRST